MIKTLTRASVLLVCCLALISCSLPRGAALESEIIDEVHNDDPTFQVVRVTRAAVPSVAQWPITGPRLGYNWLSGGRGPDSSVIRNGDRVNLTIWDSQENSLLTPLGAKVIQMNQLEVSSSGSIFVPYVDEVRVSGMTTDQARREIQTKMTAIVPAAQVQLNMVPGVNNSVDLVGGVALPQTLPLPSRNFRILSAISASGGIAASLENPLVRLIRDGNRYEIPAKDLLSTPSRNIVLRGGDQIVVEEDDRFFTALGASGTERLVYFDREVITALEAMSMIGGLSDTRANPKGVLVLREYPARAVRADGRGPTMQQVVFAIDLTSADGLFAARNFRVNPGDTVLVTESPITALNTIFSLVGRIFGIGNSVGAL